MAFVGPSETWRSVEWETPETSLPPQAPEHPITTMQGAFEESMMETISEDPDGTAELMAADSHGRRKRLLESKVYERTVAGRWKQKDGENFHPLWKLVAQISFGMHLLHKGLAKSDDEVIRILQTHVDEIDGFLERTTDDLELAQGDINERIRYLKLPLEHGDVFDNMLADRKFRNAILEGNEKIEHIVDRTSDALRDALKDVKKGFEGTRELARYFKRLDKTWERSSEEHAGVYAAMMGNTEGWTVAYMELQKKGNTLHESLVHLGGIIAEIQRRVGVASRKDIPSRANTKPNSRVPSMPPSPKRGASGSSTPIGSNRHSRHISSDSSSIDKKRVSFSDKAKDVTGKLSILPKTLSAREKKHEQNLPKTAGGPNVTSPWDDGSGSISVKDTIKSKRSKRRSLSAGNTRSAYEPEYFMGGPRGAEFPSPPSTGLSSAGLSPPSSAASSFYVPPLKVSESVYSPPYQRRQMHDPLAEEVIKEEDEEDQPPPQPAWQHNRNESVESDDLHAEIANASVHQAHKRDLSVSQMTSPTGQFRPQLREVRSIDSLPSQTRGVAGLDSLISSPQSQLVSPQSQGSQPEGQLRRSSSQSKQQPSLQNAVAMLRRSSTFSAGPSTYSSGSSRPPSELRPAPLNVPLSAHASFFRRPSSPTSVYTDNNFDKSTVGSSTPPALGSHARLDSISSSAPRSAPAVRTSFLRSESSTETSTPVAQSPRGPPSEALQLGPSSPPAEDNKKTEPTAEEHSQEDHTPTQLSAPHELPKPASVEEPQQQSDLPQGQEIPQQQEAKTPVEPNIEETHLVKEHQTKEQDQSFDKPLESPRAVAPERVPTPPKPRRMGSQSAPERIPSRPASPDLRYLTSATVSGPEPDFLFGADWEAEEEEPVKRVEELDAAPLAAELSARPPTADGEEAPSRQSRGSDISKGRETTMKEENLGGDDPEDRQMQRRSDTILRKEIEEQRKRDIAAAKRELEAINRENETKRAQADIISRVAQQTGTGSMSTSANDENSIRDQRFPTGDTQILHPPPPVIVGPASGTATPRGRSSVELVHPERTASPAHNQYAYQAHSPLASTHTSLTPPATADTTTTQRKGRSPWRKVFNIGGDKNKDKQQPPPNMSGAPYQDHDDHEFQPQPPKPEKEKKGGLSSFFRAHRKSRSAKDGRLAVASERGLPDGAGNGTTLSDGRVIRHGQWNSGEVNLHGLPLVSNPHIMANQQQQQQQQQQPRSGTATPPVMGLPAGASGPPPGMSSPPLGMVAPQGLPAGASGPPSAGPEGRYLSMNKEQGTVPVPGVGTIDFGRRSVHERMEQERLEQMRLDQQQRQQLQEEEEEEEERGDDRGHEHENGHGQDKGQVHVQVQARELEQEQEQDRDQGQVHGQVQVQEQRAEEVGDGPKGEGKY